MWDWLNELYGRTFTFGDLLCIIGMVAAIISAIISWIKSCNAKKSEKQAEKYASIANEHNIAAKQYYDDQNRPYIDIIVEMRKYDLGFVIRNSGNRTAHKIKLSFPDEFVSKLVLHNTDETCIRVFPENEYTLLPNAEYFIVFCNTTEKTFEKIKDISITIPIKYQDHREKQFLYNFHFNMKSYLWFSYVTPQPQKIKLEDVQFNKLIKHLENNKKEAPHEF